MKAVIINETGSPEVLTLKEMDEPQIRSKSEIKVKLIAAGINPIDTKVRKNGLFYPDAFPAVLGCDGAGIVTEVGPEVDAFKPGDEVWFCNGGLGREQGNYAEFTVLNQRWVAKKPKTLSFAEAAALPLVLITAWGALFDRGGLKENQTVLIHAGAGGVGHIGIQLAKLKEANVLTTVGTEDNSDFVKSLGADESINYHQEDIVERVLQCTGGKGADLVIDTVGAEVFKQSIKATAYFGTLVTLLDPGPVEFKEARIRNLKIGFELMLTPMLRNLDEARDKHVKILNQCADLLDHQRLTVKVSQCLPLEEAVKAHAAIESNHTRGKIVLEIQQP